MENRSFEEVRTDKAGLIGRICDFLEIENLSSPFAVRFSTPVNTSTHQIGRIPSDIEYKLACIYEPELRELKERFPGAPAEWPASAGRPCHDMGECGNPCTAARGCDHEFATPREIDACPPPAERRRVPCGVDAADRRLRRRL